MRARARKKRAKQEVQEAELLRAFLYLALLQKRQLARAVAHYIRTMLRWMDGSIAGSVFFGGPAPKFRSIWYQRAAWYYKIPAEQVTDAEANIIHDVWPVWEYLRSRRIEIRISWKVQF